MPFRKNLIPKGDAGKAVRERLKDEGACRRCGICCYQGFVVCGHFVLIPELPCINLRFDENGKASCVKYNSREKIEWCNTANEKTIKHGLFPPDCTYVQGVLNYHGKIEPPPGMREKIRKALLKQARHMPCPDHLRREDWLRFLIRLQKPVPEP